MIPVNLGNILLSKALLFSSSSFIVGIFLSSFVGIGKEFFLLFFIIAISLLICFRSPVFLVSLIFIFIGIGVFWFNTFDQQHRQEARSLSFFKGVISEEIENRGDRSRIIISGIDEFEEEKLLIFIRNHSSYQYGDILEVRGIIQSPKPFDDFDYPGYLAKDGIYLTIINPEITLIGNRVSYKNTILKYKERARSFLNQGLPYIHSSIVSAMLLGDKWAIPNNWKEKMSNTGTRHIVAVSGLHIAVMAAIAVAFSKIIGLYGKKSLFFIITVVFLFILITGFQPSAIRAGIMGLSLIVASFFGRINNSLRVILITAALMLSLNPILLRYDIGFQLSFLAVIGIVLFSSLLQDKMRFLPAIIRDVLAMSLSAYIFTFPLLIYYFGNISLVFPITNILIVPVLYIVMILGILFIFLSFFSSTLALVALFPLWLFVSWIIAVIQFFSKIGWSSMLIEWTNSLSITIFYGAVILFVWKKSLSMIKNSKNSIGFYIEKNI